MSLKIECKRSEEKFGKNFLQSILVVRYISLTFLELKNMCLKLGCLHTAVGGPVDTPGNPTCGFLADPSVQQSDSIWQLTGQFTIVETTLGNGKFWTSPTQASSTCPFKYKSNFIITVSYEDIGVYGFFKPIYIKKTWRKVFFS